MIATIPSPGRQSNYQPFAVVVVEVESLRTEAERVKPLRDLDRESLGVGVQSECHVDAPRGDAAGHAEPKKLYVIPRTEFFELAGQGLPKMSALVYPRESISFAPSSSILLEVVVTIKEELYNHDAVDDEVPCRERHLRHGSAQQDDADEIRLRKRVRLRVGPAATRRTPDDVRYPQGTTQRGIPDLSDFCG